MTLHGVRILEEKSLCLLVEVKFCSEIVDGLIDKK